MLSTPPFLGRSLLGWTRSNDGCRPVRPCGHRDVVTADSALVVARCGFVGCRVCESGPELVSRNDCGRRVVGLKGRVGGGIAVAQESGDGLAGIVAVVGAGGEDVRGEGGKAGG